MNKQDQMATNQWPDSAEPFDPNNWPIGFFEATAGCFQGEPLVRELQASAANAIPICRSDASSRLEALHRDDASLLPHTQTI